jgi:hypothetical protein
VRPLADIRRRQRTAPGASAKEAIICAPAHIDSCFAEEREYLVDRRLVPRVDVIERFPQRDLEAEDAIIVAEWRA